MSEKIKNPPAFPREDYQADDAPGQRGMTLRDYFAGHALAMTAPAYVNLEDSANILARRCYAVADAMLRERMKGQTP